MLDKFKIRSGAWSSEVYYNGQEDFRNKEVAITSLENVKGGGVVVHAAVMQADSGGEYSCSFALGGSGETVIGAQCTCPNRCDAFGYCRHVCAAMLTYLEQKKDPAFSERRFSSPAVAGLIAGYSVIAGRDAVPSPRDETVYIEPNLTLDNGSMELGFKIGRKRKYIVRNIPQMVECFRRRANYSYGKELEFVHRPEMLDDFGRKLLDFAAMFYDSAQSAITRSSSSYYYYQDRYGSVNKKNIELTGIWAEKFFILVRDDGVFYDGEHYEITEKEPALALELKMREKGGAYCVSFRKPMDFIQSGERIIGIDTGRHMMYLCSAGYSSTMKPLINTLASNSNILDIAAQDMASFYSAVLVPVRDFAEIDTECDLSEYIPPDAEIRLYLDSPGADEVFGRLEYTYGNDTYTAFADTAKHRALRDIRAEKSAEYYVSKYFEINPADQHHPLVLNGPDRIYDLFAFGLAELNGYMEIFASDRFSRMNIRPPVHPVVGVRPESNLLTLDIDTDGYDIQELLDMLSSYRRGMKYHRLRDGSFVDLTQGGIEDLAEMTEALNLSDKALLKKQISVPKYRMLYLNSLQERDGNIRIKRSKEFKKAVSAFTDIASSDYQPPETLENIMREYQIYGFRWMSTIAAYGFGGILADDMGLGKTLQAIALMLAQKEEDEREGKKHSLNLVVCPSSLTLNWEIEIKRFAPSLKPAVIIGTASARTELINDSADADVFITSYSILTRDIADYSDMYFRYQFIDEAQFIKNHNTQAAKAVKAIHSEIRFALTGTPVENSLAELWSIYDFIMPEYLFNYNHFKKTYETPIVRNNDEKSVKALKKITSPFILRRLKKDVLTELPDKTEITLSAEMTDEQRKLYTANVITMKKAVAEKFAAAKGSEGRFEILAMLTRLRQICCDPSLVYENYGGGSGKLEQCLELVSSCINAGHKMLLFSQFTSMLDIIAEKLNEDNIKYYMLTGATKADERLRLVNAFNKDDTPVFMISLKAGGTGLNLTGADIVIHYDPWWNVSAENQATDRVYRIGQKNNVSVYKLIMKGTIEEKILDLQKSKLELADMAVNGEGDIMRMSPSDIMEILE